MQRMRRVQCRLSLRRRLMTGTSPVAPRQLGVGLGYRPEFAQDLAGLRAAVDCIELTVEQYLDTAPERREHIIEVARTFAVTTHSLELSIGTLDGWDEAYAEKVVRFAVDVGARWFSDHLCFTRSGTTAIGALTPLYRDRRTAALIAERAARLQASAGIPFLLENITAHLDLGGDLGEGEFMAEIATAADCGILLDLANLSINAQNHGHDPHTYLETFPLDRVVEIHLAGGVSEDGVAYDTHSRETPAEVWELLRVVTREVGIAAVIIERDQDVPTSVAGFEAELAAARRMLLEGVAA